MSKYMDEWTKQYPDIKNVRKATKRILREGKELALEEWHDAYSVKRLKKKIMEDY